VEIGQQVAGQSRYRIGSVGGKRQGYRASIDHWVNGTIQYRISFSSSSISILRIDMYKIMLLCVDR
jgi:hypothetical protein